MFFRYKVEKGEIIETVLENFQGIVIGGGGLKGLSFLGAIEYFRECEVLNNLRVFAGTSAGAIICLLLVLGYSPKEQLELNLNVSYLKMKTVQNILQSQSLLDFTNLVTGLEDLCRLKLNKIPTFLELFEHTGKSLRVVSYNASKNSQQIFSETTTPSCLVTEAVKFSCAIPLIFEPQKSGEGDFYFDGGLINNLPVDAAWDVDKILLISTASPGIHHDEISFSDIVQLLISVPTVSSDFLRLQHFRLNNPEKCVFHVHLEHSFSPTATLGMNYEEKLNCFKTGYMFAKGI
jgi:predicted acylesterase/phospholipase RssA